MCTGDGGQTWTQVYPKLRPTKESSFVDNQHGFGLGKLSDSGAFLYTENGGDNMKRLFRLGMDGRFFSAGKHRCSQANEGLVDLASLRAD